MEKKNFEEAKFPVREDYPTREAYLDALALRAIWDDEAYEELLNEKLKDSKDETLV